MLWRIEGTNSHIIGTIHALTQFVQTPHQYFALAEKADIAFFECIKNSKYPRTAKPAPEHIVQKANAAISSMRKMGNRDVAGRSSVEIAGIVSDAWQYENGMLSSNCPDRQIMDRVPSDKRRQLDDREMVYRFMEEIYESTANEMALHAIEHGDEVAKSYLDIIKAWKIGDLGKVTDSILMPNLFPPIHHSLTPIRNAVWVSRILEFLVQGKDILVCGGIAHFIGEASVLALLERQGIRSVYVPKLNH